MDEKKHSLTIDSTFASIAFTKIEITNRKEICFIFFFFSL